MYLDMVCPSLKCLQPETSDSIPRALASCGVSFRFQCFLVFGVEHVIFKDNLHWDLLY